MARTLDEIDLKLLAELERDADRTNAELAGVVALSPAATYNRIRRLRDEGVISRIVARVDPAEVGFSLQVYVAVTLARHDEVAHRRFAEAVAEMPEVLSADWVTGETDALLWVVARNVSELQRDRHYPSGLTSASAPARRCLLAPSTYRASSRS